MRRCLTTLIFLGFIFTSLAQETIVKGRVIDYLSNHVLPESNIHILESNITSITDKDGYFEISGENLPLGEQVLLIEKVGYAVKRFSIIINSGKTLELSTILMEGDFDSVQSQIGVISLSDEELDGDEGSADNISGLLQSSRDIVLNAAAFDFSAAFFRPRGLDSEYGKVLINGLEMNKFYSGRPQWGNWGGLNDAQRSQIFSMGLSPSETSFGGLAGTNNIEMRASKYRKGGRVSYALSNRTYTGRIMGSYNTGLMGNGWAFSVLISRRFGDEGLIEGTLYDANGFFISVEKKLSDNHSLNLTAIYSPNRRGRSAPMTQEVYDIKGNEYNPYWGKQDGEIRNSRIREVEEPIVMLNHYWDINSKTRLNTNIGYQFGKTGSSRLGYDNANNPDPTYYQYLPSYHLSNLNGPDYTAAYFSLIKLQNDGQIDWQKIYETNITYGGTSRYYLYEDRTDDKLLMANTLFTSDINQNIIISGGVNFRQLTSENFASMLDLLGGNGYLDIDTFSSGDQSQSDLLNPNRIIQEGERFKYNYEIEATAIDAFAQAEFKYKTVDFYIGLAGSQTSYQRIGLYQNGSFPDNSLGESEKMDFTNFGAKGGLTYKISGRHLINLNAAYLTKAPTIRNTFSNSRQNNNLVLAIKSESIQNADVSYSYRSPFVRGRITGFYTSIQDATNISFYYADGISGISEYGDNFFVQEVLTGINKRLMGVEIGIEAQITPTIKLKGVATIGDYIYSDNANLYLTSDDFVEVVDFGEVYLKNYHLPGGPQRAYQLGFEYRDPDFWWMGATANLLSNGYINISPLNRTRNFYLDSDGLPFSDYDEEIARELLKQEKFDELLLVNIVGGKSWKVKRYFLGFFASVNNVFNESYKTGGFEQARNANYRNLRDDQAKEIPVFAPKYWFGYNTSYFLNVYVRF